MRRHTKPFSGVGYFSSRIEVHAKYPRSAEQTMNTMSINRLGYQKIPPIPSKDMTKSAVNSRKTNPATMRPLKHNNLGINYLGAIQGCSQLMSWTDTCCTSKKAIEEEKWATTGLVRVRGLV
jgi:hypothetical protein